MPAVGQRMEMRRRVAHAAAAFPATPPTNTPAARMPLRRIPVFSPVLGVGQFIKSYTVILANRGAKGVRYGTWCSVKHLEEQRFDVTGLGLFLLSQMNCLT
jgi:hypothetical protein